MKKLQNLKGAKALSKKEQQAVNGGAGLCIDHCYNSPVPCPDGSFCHAYRCYGIGEIVGVCISQGGEE